MESYGCVYLITNKSNGKVYVGQTTKGIGKRWSAHIKQSSHRAKSGRAICRAIRKYGSDSFSIELVKMCESREDLNSFEKRCILLTASYLPELGYNSTYGGEDGRHTPEILKKLAGINKGRKMSDEAKAKISASLIGRVVSLETRKKIGNIRRGVAVSAQSREKMSLAKKESH